MFKRIIFICIYILLIGSYVLHPAAVYSENLSKEKNISLKPDSSKFSVYLHTGRITGEANEYVMNGDTELSRLIWKIDSLYMVGGGINWEYSPAFSFNADLWLKAADGESVMDDYDWLIEGADWTHWSHHDNTIVSKGNIFDISLRYTPEVFRDKRFILKSLFGYKRTNFEWEARGGNYIYTKDSFRDTIGSFPDGQLGITYEQTFHTPYGGLEIEIPLGFLFFKTSITGSFAVFGKALDNHHLRDLVTTAYFYWGKMISMNAEAGLNLGESIRFSGNVNYEYFGGLRGDSEYDQNGTIIVYEDLEKADLKSLMLSLSLLYKL